MQLSHNLPSVGVLAENQLHKGSSVVKLSHCLVSHAWRAHIHVSYSHILIHKKTAQTLLYSNENINIRHQASQSPSLLASHLNILYLQDTSQLESCGLLSPAQDTTGKSEKCHTSSLVICQEKKPFPEMKVECQGYNDN